MLPSLLYIAQEMLNYKIIVVTLSQSMVIINVNTCLVDRQPTMRIYQPGGLPLKAKFLVDLVKVLNFLKSHLLLILFSCFSIVGYNNIFFLKTNVLFGSSMVQLVKNRWHCLYRFHCKVPKNKNLNTRVYSHDVRKRFLSPFLAFKQKIC